MGTPVQKMPAGTGALWVGESRGTQRSRLPLPVGFGSLRRKKKILCTLQKAERKCKSVHRSRGHSNPSSEMLSHMHTLNIQCQDLHGRVEQVISILVMPHSQLKGYHADGLEQAPRLTKKRRHIIQPDYTVKLKTP